MKIYHYTNLETLALILKNRTIRFNRLDKVDDIEEGNTESLGIKFSKYVFVSCWTEESEESIPLWKLYGGDIGGVRIAMEREMFQEHVVSDLNVGDLKTKGSIISIIPGKDLINPDFFIFPLVDYNNEVFYRHVKYVDDVSIYTKDAIKVVVGEGNQTAMNLQMKPFGTYKNKRWEFQKESRFVLYIMPYNPLLDSANPNVGGKFMQYVQQNKPLPFHYYDMSLKEESLNNMEVTLSPSATEAQKIIVQSLLKEYAPKATLLDSALGKVVRLK